ncbi:MAG: hypothetical protein PHR15_01215 [Atopobiaceae bacterium]|jgi:hypothetical protein|nr:hypothetical protein [Atopobiaceae bacterium]MCH4181259.1 hypothetical protein [Atopobiaceae bacterium]MCH4214789.1 hypothetical protein [Atopobiaceae bacterium]MCH4276823.1 hypothetical protein [Atopobiaceae bacterium]MCI1226168.1 hypothetical protein [Atopobiaceae bacterium]
MKIHRDRKDLDFEAAALQEVSAAHGLGVMEDLADRRGKLAEERKH